MSEIIRQEPKLTGKLGNTLIYVDPDLEDKKIDIVENGVYTLRASAGYDALNEVEIKADVVPVLQDKSVEITENGTTNVTADEGYGGLNNVEVTVNGIVKKVFFSSLPNLASSAYSNAVIACVAAAADTSSVKTLEQLFYVTGWGHPIEELDLSGWNTSNVTNMKNTFANCQVLTKINLSGWDVSKVTTFVWMFDSCKSLTELDLSSFKNGKVDSMNNMFSNCTSLQKLDMRNFDFSKVSSAITPFASVPASCLVIVKDDAAKQWVLKKRSDFTNVKTVAELDQ